MFLVTGDNWQLGAVLLLCANLCLGASLVVYDAILCEISTPDERDRVSSRGWALGYLGGGLLLAVNLVLVTLHDSFGMSQGMAVRICLLSAAIWWAAFTIIPYRGLKNREPVPPRRSSRADWCGRASASCSRRLRDMRAYPMTLTFLVAYLFFNDGIQTVIATSSTYGEKELGFETEVLIATILLVQFVAFGGALLFGRIATNVGSKKTILGGLVVWMVIVVTMAYFLPEEQLLPVPRPGRADRARARRHPGAVAVVLQPADPPRAARRSTSACTRRASAARAGWARWSSAWCTSGPTPTARRSSR